MKRFIFFSILFSFQNIYVSSEEKKRQLKRIYPEKRGVSVCKPAQVRSADHCVVSPTTSYGRGYVNNNLYHDSVDMLSISQYIYTYAQLRKTAVRANNTELVNKLKPPRKDSELRNIFHEYYHLIAKDNDDLDVTNKTLEFYFGEGQGRTLVSFHDEGDDIRHSRVYSIAVNDIKKRVDVVFRGTANVSLYNMICDWRTNLAFRKKKIPNPVEGIAKKIENVKMHSGFADALLKKRKVSNTKPIDNILDEVKKYMTQGYRLYVSGHSLGAATATIMAFFAASKSDFTKAGPVILYTYASPRVGDNSFREAFQYLEERGKIRHARIHNKVDPVSQQPFFGGMFKHVGMEIRLRPDELCIIDYPTEMSWNQEGNGLWSFLKTLPGVLKFHSPKEMLSRINNLKPALEGTSLEMEYLNVWDI